MFKNSSSRELFGLIVIIGSAVTVLAKGLGRMGANLGGLPVPEL